MGEEIWEEQVSQSECINFLGTEAIIYSMFVQYLAQWSPDVAATLSTDNNSRCDVLVPCDTRQSSISTICLVPRFLLQCSLLLWQRHLSQWVFSYVICCPSLFRLPPRGIKAKACLGIWFFPWHLYNMPKPLQPSFSNHCLYSLLATPL